jgi:hypothetical protein
MDQTAKLNLLDEELDEASQKYIQESLEEWKESVTNQLVEQLEQEKQAKLEELEEENNAYREQLKEEFTEKMLDGLNELKESIRAEVTAEVIKNNPELKIFEQVKEIVAPLVSENYRDNAYEDTITKLSEEVESLRREREIQEGAKTLASLIAPYSEKTQKVVTSLIKEGTSEEVTEQFYNIFESLSTLFEEEADDDDADKDDEGKDDTSKKEDDAADKDDESKDDDENKDDSYIDTGKEGGDDDEGEKQPKKSLKEELLAYARK